MFDRMSLLAQPAPLWGAIALAGAIAAVAWRVRSLSGSGAWAALAVGTIALRASWGLGALLIAWFVLAALLSRVGKHQKARRVEAIVAKTNARDAWQVLANGAVFAGACAGVVVIGSASGPLSTLYAVGGAGALAAAGADTWATEVGTLYGDAPWSIRTRSRVAVGTSGAITLLGSLAMVAGATVIALVAVAFGAVPFGTIGVLAVAAGGVSGASTDTLLGAWLQERRLCPRCALETERPVHVCGTPTTPVAGVALLDNDAVNFACTVIGAGVAMLVAWSSAAV
jgi:uncharacterized protein (TIGR00297 family)